MANPLCHWDLMVDDVERSKAFYGKVFDWRFDDASFPGYTLVQTGGTPAGGMMQRAPAGPAACLNNYFQVDSADDTLREVVEAGGRILMPKTAIPGVGWVALFADPDGIPIGLLEPLPDRSDRR